VNALDLKLARDLWRMRGQTLAIALVLAAATATFILSTGVHRSLTATRDAYYAQNHFADVFVNMTRAPRDILARVSSIPGVRRAEGNIIQYALLDFPGRVEPVRALISSVDETGLDKLNLVTLSEGHMPRPGQMNEIVVDQTFAKANQLALGDRIIAQIYGRRAELKIVGMGLAPNHIYSLPPGDLVPDDQHFGIFWMGRKALEGATDRRDAINSISVTLESKATEADVIRHLDVALSPYGSTGAYGREDHLSHAFLESELNQLDAMTKVIPPIFLVVSTFLVFIVLVRMVQTERPQIGLIKAFGYSDWAIGWHYLKFALAIAVISMTMGSAAGIWMGRAMTSLYAEYYRFPFLNYIFSVDVFVIAAVLAFGAAAVGALGGVLAAVRLTPAVAMSPPSPPVYRAGLIERLGRAGGFTVIGHMIVRHIFRAPGRSATTIFGVALSFGLLFSTMQFIDASKVMIDQVFVQSQHQDLTVTFTDPQNTDVVYALAQIPGVQRVETTRTIPVKITLRNRMERTAIESADPNARLTSWIDSDGSEISLPPGGLILSSQLAKQLNAHVGEDVLVEVLGGRSDLQTQRVTAVIDQIVGARAYASPETLDRIARDATPVSAALLKIDDAARSSIFKSLKEMPVVLGVSERGAALSKFQKLIDENILTMIGFYVSFASAITIGVVYNSARILFSERAHELATLRVLGYHRREVGSILLGELALLVFLAVPLGCVMGYWMAKLMMGMFSSDLFRLPFRPSDASYGYATLIVLTAAVATMLIVARRVAHLDMVRVLKARE
jgi:putative ABC transport system permease protein